MEILILCQSCICINSRFLCLFTNLCTIDTSCIQFLIIIFSKNLVHDHDTRRVQNLHLSGLSSSFGHRSIKFQVSLLWNQLPSYCQHVQSARRFLIKIRKFLLTNANAYKHVKSSISIVNIVILLQPTHNYCILLLTLFL